MLERSVHQNLTFAFIILSNESIRVNDYEIVPVFLNVRA
jgi:hypothetical protein